MYYKEIDIKGTSSGYLYFVDKDHPLKWDTFGRVHLHRHIMSIKLGRWLEREEHVHHIDEDKLNNTPSNLEVLTNSEHTKRHNIAKILKGILCPICNRTFTPKRTSVIYCSSTCASSSQQRIIIDKDTLQREIWDYPLSTLSIKYGISDTALKKKAVSYGCTMPPPRFHVKSLVDKEHIRKEYNL